MRGESGILRVDAGGREMFVYHYGEMVDLPHFFPLNTPTGKNLLVQRTEPYPHHRALWFADAVERDGTTASLYNAYYSGVNSNQSYEPPFATRVRQVAFSKLSTTNGFGEISEKLVWETERDDQPFSLLDENRIMTFLALTEGQYLMDLQFRLTATYGDVRFISDAVHYAWPYVRLDPKWTPANGGTITADDGTTGSKATNMQPAKWIDYSNTVDGQTEGIAVFQWPDGEQHRWLTRDYGTFGPRRPDHQSGKPFTLKRDESVSQRVAIYVHSGDARSGEVAKAYELYIGGRFDPRR